jgi:hypothetical protein
MKRQGITTLEFCGREIKIMRDLVRDAVSKMKGKDRSSKTVRAYYKRLQFKLYGSYCCKHCGSWVEK